jgi:hypothetical protein
MSDNKQVSAALVKAQRAFGPALKDKTNPAFRSKYADLGACIDAVIDALNGAGIALIQRTMPCDSGVTVETVFLHESGESLSCGPLHVPAAKQDPQGYGSALTYARRYSLMAACGIAPEDDDGNAGSKRPAANQKAKAEAEAWDKRVSELEDLANFMIDAHQNGKDLDAIRMWYDPATFSADNPTANEERKHVWGLLREVSKLRSAIKANNPHEQKEQKAPA